MTYQEEDTMAVGVTSLWAFFIGLVGALAVLVWSEVSVHGPGRQHMPHDGPPVLLAALGTLFPTAFFVGALTQYARYRNVPRVSVAPARAGMLLHAGLVVFNVVFGIVLPG
ncbi:hypothetical protein [Pandoraea terrae]|nr:hypothetical protein [Pandoraea terrae]